MRDRRCMGTMTLVLFAFARILRAQTELDAQLQKVDFEQHPGEQVSLKLPFKDEHGIDVTLGSYAHGKPMILVPGYYECPMLCRAVGTGLINALRDLPLAPGSDFELISVSIDPAETPALAAQKKQSYLNAYRKPGGQTGWHFLTGDEAAIRQLTAEIGFRYYYDPRSKQFAHPSGVVVLTPSGKISHYLFGVNFSSEDLRRAVTDAAGERSGSVIRRLLLMCFHYQPITGRFALAALNVVRVTGVAVVVGMITWIVRALRAEKHRASKPAC